jgi:diaminopimelate epimerase
MKLAFVKMHGIGNDFVLIDNMSRQVDLGTEQIRLLADRRRGIGCDQLLMIEPPHARAAHVRARVFNSDGSEAGQCGNGLRCVAAWLRDAGIANGESISIEVGDGVVRARLSNHHEVKMDMGMPRFEPSDVPFLAEKRAPAYRVQVGAQRLEIGAVSMGNPHAVIRVDDCDSAPVGELGPAVQRLDAFPEGVNVGFMQVIDEARVRLRVFERGVGETLACGSGACAAVAVGHVRGWLGTRVSVTLPGGELVVDWDGEGTPMWLTGSTQCAFQGEFNL